MHRTVPEYIQEAAVSGAALKHKWDAKVAMRYIAKKDIPRLYGPIDACSFRGKMSLGAALTEWVAWRLEGHTDVADAFLRIDAAWASVVDPAYVKTLEFKMTRGIHDSEPALGPMEISLALLEEHYNAYSKGNIYLAEELVNHAELARHIIPRKKAFTDWFTDVLRRLSDTFPRGEEYDRDSEFYDASGEDPVPREFFSPSFEYSKKAADSALASFLSSLDPAANPYLATPEEMKAAGFEGTPYKL